jgi:formate--tetrahydrofolate ligase
LAFFGASKIIYSDVAKEKIEKLNNSKYKNMPICIAKTPLSVTDNKNVLGAPTNFEMTVTDILIQNGAGFIVVYMGNILTMPGLGKHPNFENMKLNN